LKTEKEKHQQGIDLKHARTHQIYAKVLESFVAAQKDCSLHNIKLTLAGVSKVVNIKVPCMFIIGDIQGGDKICCSSATYQNTVNRICRKCDVQGADVGKPNIICHRIRMTDVKQLLVNNDIESLKKLNQHNVWSAFFDVDFGSCEYGVFSAAMPIEALHSLENGLMKDLLKVLFDTMAPSFASELDKLAKK